MATKKPSNQRRTPAARPPVRGGRPAGLFTWLAVGLVVVVVAALVIIKVASGGGTPTAGKTTWQAANPTTVAQLTGVKASVFNAVGVTSPIAEVTPPLAIKKQTELTATNASGQTVPEVLYIGAEFCPFCAAQRWSTIVALSRFGTFTGLGNMSSYSGDEDPNTPTFTFLKAKYTSQYLVFKTVETYTNYLDAAGTYYAPLQTPTAAEDAIIKKYDTTKYVTYFTSSTQDGSIPFISFANQFIVAGASYSPTTLDGSTRAEIAAALDNPTSPVTQAIISSANYQTATICTLTKQQPSNVCSSAGVATAAKAMGIK